jgi:phospholipase/carboxylesterase
MMLDTEFYPARKSDSKALMIVLHGLGDSTAGYTWVPGALDLPWMNYLLVNAPDTYYGGFSWFDFAGDFRPGVERSRKLLFELLDDQRAKGFPTGETTLFGFSQGCLMTIDVGLRYPHKFAGLVGISGFVFEPQELVRELSPVARDQRLLVTHGTSDTMVPLHQTEAAIKLLKLSGLNVEWHVLEKDHTIAGQEEMEIIRRFIEAEYR